MGVCVFKARLEHRQVVAEGMAKGETAIEWEERNKEFTNIYIKLDIEFDREKQMGFVDITNGDFVYFSPDRNMALVDLEIGWKPAAEDEEE